MPDVNHPVPSPLPQVLREMRVKGAMMDHKEIRAAMGVRVVAQGLEHAVAGTRCGTSVEPVWNQVCLEGSISPGFPFLPLNPFPPPHSPPFLTLSSQTCSMFVIKPEDDEEELRATVMDDMADIFSKVDKGGEGVCVQVRRG